MVEVSETVVVTVLVFVTEGVGIDRQEHAEDRTGAAKFVSTAGISKPLLDLPELTPRLSAVGEAVSSDVVKTMAVVVMVLLVRVSSGLYALYVMLARTILQWKWKWDR